jgi:hypothetical protein
MDTAGLYVLPHAEDPVEVDLREVEVAIEMVVRGAARRIRLVGLTAPDLVAPEALARAQAAGIEFRIDHLDGTTRLTFGPSD